MLLDFFVCWIDLEVFLVVDVWLGFVVEYFGLFVLFVVRWIMWLSNCFGMLFVVFILRMLIFYRSIKLIVLSVRILDMWERLFIFR